MNHQLRGLFINNKKAKDSIYESGFMAYECLKLSDKFTIDYLEIDIDNKVVPRGYDFYCFNYHLVTMSWLSTKELKKQLGFVITIVLEVSPNDPFVMCSSTHFDAYCVLDPTIKKSGTKVYPFPRPLEKVDFELSLKENEIPVIGTFGFATKGKGFQHVVEAVNKEFDNAIVKINIPYGDFVPNSKEYAQYLAELCKNKAKQGIEVVVTNDFMSKKELIEWCAANTLNCFLYDRDMPGLAATTDQAIVTGRPLSVSDNETFRHITSYFPPYPKFSLKDSISKSPSIVKKMQQDWSPESFAKKFENLLEENLKKITSKKSYDNDFIDLKLREDNIFDLIEQRFKKYKRKIIKISTSLLHKKNDSKHTKEII